MFGFNDQHEMVKINNVSASEALRSMRVNKLLNQAAISISSLSFWISKFPKNLFLFLNTIFL